MSTDVLTLEEKQKLLRELKEVQWTGAYRVRFADRDVTYRSHEELRAAIGSLEAEIRSSSPARRLPAFVLASYSSGN